MNFHAAIKLLLNLSTSYLTIARAFTRIVYLQEQPTYLHSGFYTKIVYVRSADFRGELLVFKYQ